MKKRLPIIIIAVLVVVFAGLGFYSHQKSKIKYNTSYVNGNTAGNLYNAGLFCEKNGTVYFANPDDDYRLYSMDTNGNHLKKLSYDRVMYINADDHYVYYVRNNENNGTGFDFFSYARNSLCRIDQNGENTKILDKDPCLYASLVGNYIYYLHYDDKDATTLYKIGIDGGVAQEQESHLCLFRVLLLPTLFLHCVQVCGSMSSQSHCCSDNMSHNHLVFRPASTDH